MSFWVAVTAALGAIHARYAWRSRADLIAMLVPTLVALICFTSALWAVT